MRKKPVSFFDIIDLCCDLDRENSTMFGKRRTRFQLEDGGTVLFRVSHTENSFIHNIARSLSRKDDLTEEIVKMHSEASEAVRSYKACEAAHDG